MFFNNCLSAFKDFLDLFILKHDNFKIEGLNLSYLKAREFYSLPVFFIFLGTKTNNYMQLHFWFSQELRANQSINV